MTDEVDTPDAPPNARYTELGGGIVSELISNQVQFFYDPTTGEARAIFNGMDYLNINEVYHSLNSITDILHVDFTGIFAKRYAAGLPTPLLDPVTQVDLAGVSVAGVMTLLKLVYDIEVNAREAARLAALATAQAVALATTTYNGIADTAVDDPTLCNYTVSTNGLAVTFTDTSVPSTGQTIATYGWYFGDSVGTSALAELTYTFASAGTYTVLHYFTDSNGVSRRVAKNVTVSALVVAS